MLHVLQNEEHPSNLQHSTASWTTAANCLTALQPGQPEWASIRKTHSLTSYFYGYCAKF